MSTYREWRPTLQPSALRGPWGTAWAQGHGELEDACLALAKDAVLQGFVLSAPADSLSRHGADAGLARGPSETDDAYRARIAGAWEAWQWAGTRYGITVALGLLGYGYPSVWSYRELPPDTDTSRWSRVVVVYRGLPAWDGTATWDGTDTWDSVRSPDALEGYTEADIAPDLRRALRKWVNARDVVDRVVVAYGSLLWDLDSLWDSTDLWDEGDGWSLWQSPAWDSTDTDALRDNAVVRWDAFC